MRELIYLSTRKLAMFYPGHISRSVQFTGGLGLGSVSAKIDISAAPSGTDEATITQLNRAVRYLEREAVYFSHSGLSPGRWIFFDLNMGYGTSYRDSGSPPKIDDIAFFHGSFGQVETDKQEPIDMLLCGSTEHLRIRTASAGRMGSGTEWLYDLIGEIEEVDALGNGELPDSLNPEACRETRKYARRDSPMGVRCHQKAPRADSVCEASRVRPHPLHCSGHGIQCTSRTSHSSLRAIRVLKASRNTHASAHAARVVWAPRSSLAEVAAQPASGRSWKGVHPPRRTGRPLGRTGERCSHSHPDMERTGPAASS